jgi:hypothetical protein
MKRKSLLEIIIISLTTIMNHHSTHDLQQQQHYYTLCLMHTHFFSDYYFVEEIKEIIILRLCRLELFVGGMRCGQNNLKIKAGSLSLDIQPLLQKSDKLSKIYSYSDRFYSNFLACFMTKPDSPLFV